MSQDEYDFENDPRFDVGKQNGEVRRISKPRKDEEDPDACKFCGQDVTESLYNAKIKLVRGDFSTFRDNDYLEGEDRICSDCAQKIARGIRNGDLI